MTLQFIDGCTEVTSGIRPEWTGSFSGTAQGRDGSTNGAGVVASSTPTVTLPTSTATVITGMGLWFTGAAFGGTVNAFLNFVRSGTTELVIYLNASGFFEVRRSSRTGTLLGTSSGHPAISSAVWAHFQVKATLHATAGSVELRLDGTTILTLSGVATAGTTGNTTALIYAAQTSGGGLQRFDDIYICDTVDATATQGFANNDFLGDQKVAALRPNAEGDSSQWTPSTGTSHSATVDENPVNTTDYVSSAQTGNLDLFNYEDLPSSAQTVRAVQVVTYAASDDAGAVSIKPSVKENGVTTDQAAVALSTTYTQKFAPMLTRRPSDSTKWLVADVNALQAGVKVG